MIKRDITYKDLDGNDVTKTFYFSYSLADVLAKSSDGKYSEYLQEVVASKDGRRIMKTFSEMLEESVGIRSEDGTYLIQDSSVTESFIRSEAFSVLLWDLLNDAAFAAEFIAGIFPKDLSEKAQELAAKAGSTVQLPAEPPKRAEDYTQDELMAMSSEEFYALVGRNTASWSYPILQVAMKRRVVGKE